MKRLLTHSDLVFIGHLKSVLEDRGIPCYIRNEHLGGAAGELPLNEVWPQLWVLDEHHFERAESLLESVNAESTSPKAGVSWACPTCSEMIEPQFTECWRCAGGSTLTA
jgi:hypothetical protein